MIAKELFIRKGLYTTLYLGNIKHRELRKDVYLVNISSVAGKKRITRHWYLTW